MAPTREFMLHVELHGLFTVYVYPSTTGASLEFFPYPATEKDFPAYLAERFKHLGEPSDCIIDPDTNCFRVKFPGLRFASPEEALISIFRKT